MTENPPLAGIIGIDPGASGAIAYVWRQGDAATWPLKEMTERDVWDILQKLGGIARFAVIEYVSAMPAQGVSSTFKFGMSYGGLRMALVGAGVPFEPVTPGVWQRKMKCLTGGDKKISKAKAQELFPEVPKITHAIADAILIAEYGRTKR